MWKAFAKCQTAQLVDVFRNCNPRACERLLRYGGGRGADHGGSDGVCARNDVYVRSRFWDTGTGRCIARGEMTATDWPCWCGLIRKFGQRGGKVVHDGPKCTLEF